MRACLRAVDLAPFTIYICIPYIYIYLGIYKYINIHSISVYISLSSSAILCSRSSSTTANKSERNSASCTELWSWCQPLCVCIYHLFQSPAAPPPLPHHLSMYLIWVQQRWGPKVFSNTQPASRQSSRFNEWVFITRSSRDVPQLYRYIWIGSFDKDPKIYINIQ